MQLKRTTRDTGYAAAEPDTPDTTRYAPAETYFTEAPPTSVRQRPDAPELRSIGPGARGQSIIDAHSTFDGRYETDQDLRVEGTISGEIICRGELTVERDATVNAHISARDATVRGRLDGEVTCTGRLTLNSTAIVTGTFKTSTLVVEEGAALRGSVETAQEGVPPVVGRVSRVGPSPAVAEPPPAVVADPDSRDQAQPGSNGGRNGRTAREVPSFALVSSDERADRG